MNPPKRSGRPPLYPGEPMLQIGTRVPAPVHERLMELSNRSGRAVHELVREAVVRLVRARENRPA